jgi:hypothetical protein
MQINTVCVHEKYKHYFLFSFRVERNSKISSKEGRLTQFDRPSVELKVFCEHDEWTLFLVFSKNKTHQQDF